MHDDTLHDHPESSSLMGRRKALSLLAVAASGGLLSWSRANAADAATCTVAANNTEGPFPADGSNRMGAHVVNVLRQSGVVRSNITASFGRSSGKASGVPLVLTITLEDAAKGCQPAAHYAIYVWHCDRNGDYSLYAERFTHQNYLRGVQVTDDKGQVTFTTIVPACYQGRMPHIHVEVFASLATATIEDNALKITQLTFDRPTMQAFYTKAPGYRGSLDSLADITFDSDMVFADDTQAELAASMITLEGSIAAGYTGRARIVV